MDDVGCWVFVQCQVLLDDDVFVLKCGFVMIDFDVFEYIVWMLLCCYGVVFWWLFECEVDWLLSWCEFVCVLQCFEVCGEICGGCFVVGFVGEQFVLFEVILILCEL